MVFAAPNLLTMSRNVGLSDSRFIIYAEELPDACRSVP
jgi:hypothetical protein